MMMCSFRRRQVNAATIRKMFVLILMLALAGCAQPSATTAGITEEPATSTSPPSVVATRDETEVTSEPTIAIVVPTLQLPVIDNLLPTPDVAQLTRSNEVIATGSVAAEQDANVVFQINGTVQQVFVEEGTRVDAGQVLAVLDARALDQSIRDAEAALVSAQAELAALDEPPTDEATRAAQALVDQAIANYNQVVNAVSTQDILAAQSAVNEAYEALAELQRGADPLDRQAAQNRIDQARVQLQSTRDQLSQAKTQAEIALQQASERVRAAQTDYSAAYWHWRYVEDYNRAPPDVNTSGGSGPELSDFSRQGFRDRLTQAEIALNAAYADLEAAEKNVERARQEEINGVQAAEEQLRSAEIAFDEVLEPAKPDQIAAAQARIAQAEASLARLVGPEREAQIAAAQAQIDNARANLDRLDEAPQESARTRAQANIERAQSNLDRALLNREYAELKAPFAGEVAEVNIDVGDAAPTGGGTGAMRLVDLSTLYVELEISDADIAKIQLGQPAVVQADALPEQQFTGKVVFISPTAIKIGTVTNYLVKVRLDSANIPLRVGMQVSASLEVVAPAPTPTTNPASLNDSQ